MSRAAHAFNAFHAAQHRYELVRLCALWDSADEAKENIPTMIELIDEPAVIDVLAAAVEEQWLDNGLIANSSEDAELRRIEEEGLRSANERFGKEQAQKARMQLAKAIAMRAACSAPRDTRADEYPRQAWTKPAAFDPLGRGRAMRPTTVVAVIQTTWG